MPRHPSDVKTVGAARDGARTTPRIRKIRCKMASVSYYSRINVTSLFFASGSALYMARPRAAITQSEDTHDTYDTVPVDRLYDRRRTDHHVPGPSDGPEPRTESVHHGRRHMGQVRGGKDLGRHERGLPRSGRQREHLGGRKMRPESLRRTGKRAADPPLRQRRKPAEELRRGPVRLAPRHLCGPGEQRLGDRRPGQ